MSLKNQRFIYTAKNFTTGLADVTANIRRNGVSAATGVSLADIGNGNYELLLTPALQTTYGGEGYYDVYVNSASKDAPALAARWLLENDSSDNEIHLQAIETKIDALAAAQLVTQGDVTSIKATVEDSNTILNDASHGNANLKALLDAIQSVTTNISNVVRFNAAVLPQLIRKEVGSKTYKVPVYIYDNAGNMEDPDNSEVALTIKNSAGIVRDTLITGFVTQPHYIVKNATGDYYFELTIPDTAAIEPLNFEFSYSEAAIPLVHNKSSEIVLEAQASGLALEATSQLILTDTADIQPKVTTILGILQDAAHGNAALKALLDTIDGNTDGVEAELADAVHGLPALRTQLDLKASQSSVNILQSSVNSTQGAGFVEGEDSLEAISERVYQGGRAI